MALAQDLTADELEVLLSLSDNVAICGDARQGIYDKNGLSAVEKLALQPHTLKRHFRIGQKIAKVADRLMPPENPADSLEAMSNYDLKAQGESSAHMNPCANRDEQFEQREPCIAAGGPEPRHGVIRCSSCRCRRCRPRHRRRRRRRTRRCRRRRVRPAGEIPGLRAVEVDHGRA